MNNEKTEEQPCCSQKQLTQRRFLEKLSIGLMSLCGAIMAIPAVGFILGPLTRKSPRMWRTLGKVSDFEIGTTVNVKFQDSSPLPWAGVTANTAVWLRRVNEKDFIAFAVNCSHLGCPVRWLANANLFMCPCHGGVYYADGRVAAGPPPRPLTRYAVKIKDDEVQLQTRPTPIT